MITCGNVAIWVDPGARGFCDARQALEAAPPDGIKMAETVFVRFDGGDR